MTNAIHQLRLQQRQQALHEGRETRSERRDLRDTQGQDADQQQDASIGAADASRDARKTKSFWKKLSGVAHAVAEGIGTIPIITAFVPDPVAAIGLLAGKGYGIHKVTEHTAGTWIGEKANDGHEKRNVELGLASKQQGLKVDLLNAEIDQRGEELSARSDEIRQLKDMNAEWRRLQADLHRDRA